MCAEANVITKQFIVQQWSERNKQANDSTSKKASG
jgi:hypothetical protein